ncbi:MAG: phosphotransferase [Candidatus Hodarchaeales archaeon]
MGHLSYNEIQKLVELFDIGSFNRVETQLESGFQSDNYHIKTSKGDYVFRIVHDSLNNVEYCMEIYDYLANHGIKTPKPISTKNGTLSLPWEGKVIVVQTYLHGANIEDKPLEVIDKLLPFFGEELGKIHKVSLHMVEELGERKFSTRQDSISYVFNAAKQYLPQNKYIRTQYKEWEQEIQTIPKDKLTKAVIHGDVGPKDFFFKDGEYTGIIDFNAAHLDYLLFDIAPMVMYCNLIESKRQDKFISFINSYFKESPVNVEELKWLHLILRTRWLIQILYHQYRYEEGITQGLIDGKVEDNLQGVRDGEFLLKKTNEYSNDYFYTVIVS